MKNMKANLNITIDRYQIREKAILSHVYFSVSRPGTYETIASLNFEGLEHADYLVKSGHYDGDIKMSPKFKRNSIYINVPKRSGIMIHEGNTIRDTLGCLLVGLERPLPSVIGSSRKAIDLINTLLSVFEFEEIYVTYLDYDYLPF